MISPRLLVVVAHPDDETFGCGSLLLHAKAAGASTAVCCATRGESGKGGDDPVALGKTREAELRAATSLLGVDRLDVLDFRDSGMDEEPVASSLATMPLDDVTAKVVEVVEDFRPHVIITLDGSDGHRDHVVIREATLVAAQRATWRVQRVFLLCLLKSLLQEWFEHMRATSPDNEMLASYVGDLGTPDEEVTTVIDTAPYRQKRLEAVVAHASQSSPFDMVPEPIRTTFLTKDFLKQVLPPWQGGPQTTDIFQGLQLDER